MFKPFVWNLPTFLLWFTSCREMSVSWLKLTELPVCHWAISPGHPVVWRTWSGGNHHCQVIAWSKERNVIKLTVQRSPARPVSFKFNTDLCRSKYWPRWSHLCLLSKPWHSKDSWDEMYMFTAAKYLHGLLCCVLVS